MAACTLMVGDRVVDDDVAEEGEALSGFMPRWTLSPTDLDTLIDGLKTL